MLNIVELRRNLMSVKSFIERLMSVFKYIYNNIQYLEYDERHEFLSMLNYWKDRILLQKFELTDFKR